MRAVVQILSKGKVAAEEVRGQLGERFPGAVIKFAQANRMSVQELDQAFQAGSVTIEQFITFARKNYKDGGKYAEILADSTEYAGRRMEKALENMRLAVGRSLKESGAGFQNFAAETAESLLWLGQQLYAFGDAAERALGGTPGPTGNAKEIAERIIGGGTTVAAIEEAIRTYEGKVQEAKDRLNAVKTRNIFQFIFDETFGQGTPTQQQTGKTVASFESRIQSLREALKLADDYTRRGKRGAGSGSQDPAAADRAKSLLSAIEQREEALAQARIQREEQIAEIRKQAIEQARQLERQFADERTAVERDIAKNRRELNDLQASAQLSFRAETTQNPFLVDAERGISEILRRSREERIRIDAEYSDKQTQRARLLADFQKKVADDINKANETYARQIGNIQREYAKNVAKIVEEGTGAAGKRLEVSSKIAALYMQRASLNAVVAQATGVVVSEPDKKGENVVTAGTLLNSRIGAPAQLPIRSIIQIDEQLQQLQGRLQQLAPSLPAAPAVGPVRPLPRSQQIDIPSLSALDRATAEQRGTAERLVREQEADAIRNRFISITEESNKQVQNLQEQNTLLNLQAKYLSTGVNTELARQFAQEELSYIKRKARLDTERQEAIRQGLDVQAINTLYEGRLNILNDQYAVLMRQTEELDKQQRLLRLRQDSDIGAGIREGAQKYVESIGTMREATSQLAQTGIKGVEDAIFSLTTTGTANFQEFAKSILENTARMIIQQLILRSVMQIIGAIGGGGSSGFSFSGAGPVSGASVFGSTQAGFNPLAFSGVKLNALGNAYAANGIQPFAMGGIVKRPTMFAFANGGAGRLGLMGEAGPEAIMPLRRLPNGRLGVEQAGGGAPVTVNVSVDASGTAVQGDAGQGEQLGRVVAQAVQAELIKQRRPGGLLNR
jgi:lambda family phage tail tape measure protein